MSSQKLLKICKLKQKNTLASLTVVVRRLAWKGGRDSSVLFPLHNRSQKQ